MSNNAPNIFPTLRYAEADAALDWLVHVFGFTQQAAHRDDDGAVRHAELSLGAGMIMFGQGEKGGRGIYVAVPDADEHYARARAAGAQITREIETTSYGSREFSVRDLEGNRWSFGTYLPEAATG